MGRPGYHALTCRTGGSLGIRHNALREIVLHYCKLAKIEAVREAPNLLPNSSDRPADVLLPKNIFIEGYNPSLRTCLDFAVTHPQQPATIKRAGILSGATAARYEEAVKLPRYLQECSANNLDFIPMLRWLWRRSGHGVDGQSRFLSSSRGRQPSTRRIRRITLNPSSVLLST